MKLKSIIRNVIVICTLGLVIGSSNNLFASDINSDSIVNILGNYEYPVTPADSEWAELTVKEQVKVCRISSKILKRMSDEQLIQAIIDYPFICDVFAYSTLEYGVEVMEKTCDAYAELVSRDSGKESLVVFLGRRGDYEFLSITERVDNEYLIALVLYQEKFQDSLTDVEIDMFINMSFMEQDRRNSVAPCAILYTPNGEIVFAETVPCVLTDAHIEEHNTMDANILSAHPRATKVGEGSCSYNCHSYAWYSQSATNRYWIGNPAPYMTTDGSYVKSIEALGASSIGVEKDDKIFYGTITNEIVSSNSHSGIIYDERSAVALGSRKVISKWGAAGIFIHEAADILAGYDSENVSVWHHR